MQNNDYSTINGFAEASFIERKSEFIGYIKHVETNDEAVDFINEIRAKHRKATHNVYAYILRDGATSRYSDDGEPQGTAGVPVLDVLQKEGLTDICCVVTRYFGGILLGGGGLVRAYSHSAKIAVEASERLIMCRCFPIDVTVDYNLYGKINYVLPDFEVKLLDTIFASDVTLKMLVKIDYIDKLKEKITDITNGNLLIEQFDECFENFA
ncbi:MAG: YigZ family protein [Oscillospiraceae bacterium]|nr:YigZ family protein [Oscillospiraceae bacterium]